MIYGVLSEKLLSPEKSEVRNQYSPGVTVLNIQAVIDPSQQLDQVFSLVLGQSWTLAAK